MSEGHPFTLHHSPITTLPFHYSKIHYCCVFWKGWKGDRPKYSNNTTGKDRIKDRFNDRIKGEKPKYPSEVPGKPEEKENLLLQKIKENPLVTAAELSAFLQINVRNTRKYLAKLKEEGKIKRVGSRKNGNWEVIELP